MRTLLIQSTFVKSDDGLITNLNMQKLDKQLSRLVPGKYKLTIQKEDTDLEKMKKFYFVMESGIAAFTGHSKVELHIALKKHVGLIVNDKGKKVYESIAKVKTTERMMERIVELQEFAAKTFNYVTEPYRDVE